MYVLCYQLLLYAVFTTVATTFDFVLLSHLYRITVAWQGSLLVCECRFAAVISHMYFFFLTLACLFVHQSVLIVDRLCIHYCSNAHSCTHCVRKVDRLFSHITLLCFNIYAQLVNALPEIISHVSCLCLFSLPFYHQKNGKCCA